MNNLTETEQKALDIMKKENFRGISKDNVMQLMTILDKVEPEVAKDIIAQFPEVARLVGESEKSYFEVVSKGIDSCERSVQSCYDSEDEFLRYLQSESQKEGISFEEKKYYTDKMEEALKRKEGKDTEHKTIMMNVLRIGGNIFLAGLAVAVVLLGGNANIKLPGTKA